jgi:hypothetical protein
MKILKIIAAAAVILIISCTDRQAVKETGGIEMEIKQPASERIADI